MKGRSQRPCGLRLGSTAARLLGLRVRIPPRHGCLSLVIVVCCQVQVSATGRSLVQRSPTECGVSECDREASIIRRPRPPRGCRAIGRHTWKSMFTTRHKANGSFPTCLRNVGKHNPTILYHISEDLNRQMSVLPPQHTCPTHDT
jgi:hypothetical protein